MRQSFTRRELLALFSPIEYIQGNLRREIWEKGDRFIFSSFTSKQ